MKSGVQRGVTLVELVIVMAILGVAIGFSVPFFQASRVNADVRSSAMDLASALNIARNQSVSLRMDVEVAAIGGDWLNGWEVRYLYPATVPAAARTEQDMAFPRGGTVNIAETGGSTLLRFQPSGVLAGGQRVFTLCREGRGRTITVSPFGRVTTLENPC